MPHMEALVEWIKLEQHECSTGFTSVWRSGSKTGVKSVENGLEPKKHGDHLYSHVA